MRAVDELAAAAVPQQVIDRLNGQGEGIGRRGLGDSERFNTREQQHGADHLAILTADGRGVSLNAHDCIHQSGVVHAVLFYGDGADISVAESEFERDVSSRKGVRTYDSLDLDPLAVIGARAEAMKTDRLSIVGKRGVADDGQLAKFQHGSKLAGAGHGFQVDNRTWSDGKQGYERRRDEDGLGAVPNKHGRETVVNECVVVRYNGVQADGVAVPGLVNRKVVCLPSRSNRKSELCEGAGAGQSGHGEHREDVAPDGPGVVGWTFHICLGAGDYPTLLISACSAFFDTDLTPGSIDLSFCGGKAPKAGAEERAFRRGWMSPVMQYADEIHDAAYEIRVYRGADGVFPLYEDEGDNYNFESGRFSIVMLRWSELDGELIIAERAGDFEGIVTSRQLHIVFIPKAAGSRAEIGRAHV